MTRSRRSSIVQDIASKNLGSHELPVYTDDLLQILKNIEPHWNPEPLQTANHGIDDKYKEYFDYLEQLDSKNGYYTKLREKSSNIAGKLSLILEKFEVISADTEAFQLSTDPLAKKLLDSEDTYTQIQNELQYFQNLDPISRKLNHYSSPNIVLRDSFKQNFVKIDESLKFLEEHSDYLEADSYRIRFKQCLIRACSLVSDYLNNQIKAINTDITLRLNAGGTQLAANSQDALLYNKFATVAPTYIQLIGTISEHARYDEIESVLKDCVSTYFNSRARLLKNSIWLQLNQTIVRSNQTVKFIQDNLLYFENLAHREFNLFSQFYPINEDIETSFNEWCMELFEPLYDCVRTRILRETSISTICDSITLLNKYYQMEETSPEYKLQFQHIKIDMLFKPILKECQSRLIFRSQIYVEENINSYKPKVDSFIIRHRKTPKEAKNKANDLDEISTSFFQLDEFNSAYPPLVYGIALLSKIYQMVNSTVFDDIAHTIVHDCIMSLKKAFQLVSTNATINLLDTQLSLLKNLLLLRDQIQNFDIQYISKETYLDFSGLLKGINDIRRRTISVFQMGFDTVPKIINNMVDARSELIAELRNTINGITKTAADQITKDYLSISETGDKLLEQNMEVRKSIEINLVSIFDQISNFITNDEVKSHLVDAIQQEVVSRYASYYETLADSAKIDSQKLSEIMYIDVFQNFINNETAKLLAKP
ncbi:Golgi transport complex subunit COG3 [Kluyveromyces lactis]|uniref:Conserved oligomeric Golgi complex subunit 3 n=1 Tax=Kluyveromyces lactis (strain ATCC 8585 / CBS 2359 / DSM 70799 / NBRC 1267 / NRRL Y-1140 / WM37) TaxID=284590 RepID=Q6CTL6_KLULA|nr:uncharacterized protein KLLA0_C11715g [Kluyveromyces lactis]CAH01574.1 KLLA0C11715p [Kluyveromyces lactis]|eukprot:XP_452723.1 uncharacterized protein KLLA0_C11715g [Kluyveromyces lactis]